MRNLAERPNRGYLEAGWHFCASMCYWILGDGYEDAMGVLGGRPVSFELLAVQSSFSGESVTREAEMGGW